MANKKIIYVDLDGVIVNLLGYIDKQYTAEQVNKIGYGTIIDRDSRPFYKAEPIEGALDAIELLNESDKYDVFLLSTAPWANEDAWTAKRVWVEKYLGFSMNRRLILTHRKDLLKGDYLIDDRPNNGADAFEGELLKFGQGEYKDWNAVLNYLKP
jgi:5'(3')-deoxyribonucleotidase|tara:strand:+ start:804 stop:1268 length:465 start_codon:yes stop_codon:yes gene_type:complete